MLVERKLFATLRAMSWSQFDGSRRVENTDTNQIFFEVALIGQVIALRWFCNY